MMRCASNSLCEPPRPEQAHGQPRLRPNGLVDSATLGRFNDKTVDGTMRGHDMARGEEGNGQAA